MKITLDDERLLVERKKTEKENAKKMLEAKPFIPAEK